MATETFSGLFEHSMMSKGSADADAIDILLDSTLGCLPDSLQGLPCSLSYSSLFVDKSSIKSASNEHRSDTPPSDFLHEIFDLDHFGDPLQSPTVSEEGILDDCRSVTSQTSEFGIPLDLLNGLPSMFNTYNTVELSISQPPSHLLDNEKQALTTQQLHGVLESINPAGSNTALIPISCLDAEDLSPVAFLSTQSRLSIPDFSVPASPSSIPELLWPEWASPMLLASNTRVFPSEIFNSCQHTSQSMCVIPCRSLPRASQNPVIDLTDSSELDITCVSEPTTIFSTMPTSVPDFCTNSEPRSCLDKGHISSVLFDGSSKKRRADTLESPSLPCQQTRKNLKYSPASYEEVHVNSQHPRISVSNIDHYKAGNKKVTDSAHYRPRNAFFVFRGFVSRLQSSWQPDVRRRMTPTSTIPITSAPSRLISFPYTSLTPVSSTSTWTPISASSLASNKKAPVRIAQTKVSVSCGKIWSSECFDTCGIGGCANCRMRSLFSRASDFLKLRQTELERQIEFSESVGDGDSSALGYSADMAISRQVGIGRDTDGLARLTLEDSFNWKEFKTLYYDSDLFKWHRQEYLGESGAPDLDEMKRIWMDNERNYERSFLEGARRRIQQDGSRNAKKGAVQDRHDRCESVKFSLTRV